MREIALAFLLSSGTMVMGQAASPAPVNPDQLFQPPPALGGQAPRFKLQTPGGKRGLFALPGPVIVQPQVQRPLLDRNVDKGMVIHPPSGSFAKQEPRPAISQHLYPGLKVMPIEFASLAGAPVPTGSSSSAAALRPSK